MAEAEEAEEVAESIAIASITYSPDGLARPPWESLAAAAAAVVVLRLAFGRFDRTRSQDFAPPLWGNSRARSLVEWAAGMR